MDPFLDEFENLQRTYWHDSLGRRVFGFDAFISHNQFDGSNRLATELRARGAHIWHDEDVGIPDRRVIEKVKSAINASRYVIVYIGDGFRDSKWVRAEYVPALLQSREWAFERIIIVCTERATVPGALQICRMFAPSQLDEIADFVTKGNLFCFEPTVLCKDCHGVAVSHYTKAKQRVQLGRERLLAALEHYLQDQNRDERHLARELHQAVAHPSVATDIFRDMDNAQYHDAMRTLVKAASQDCPQLLETAQDAIAFIGWAALSSSQVDQRSIGFALLETLERNNLGGTYLSASLVCYLNEERHEVMLRYAHPWFVERGYSIAERSVAEFYAARVPWVFRGGDNAEINNDLDEAVRARIFVHTDVLLELEDDEKVVLAKRALEHLLMQLSRDKPAAVPASAKYRVDNCVNELFACWRDATPVRRSVLGESFLECYEKIIVLAEEFKGAPWITIAPNEVAYVVEPLLGWLHQDQHREKASALASRALMNLEQHYPLEPMKALFRDMHRRLLNEGESYSGRYWSMQAFEARNAAGTINRRLYLKVLKSLLLLAAQQAGVAPDPKLMADLTALGSLSEAQMAAIPHIPDGDVRHRFADQQTLRYARHLMEEQEVRGAPAELPFETKRSIVAMLVAKGG